MDLGNTSKMSEPSALAAIPEKAKVSYPGFTLNDATAEAFRKEYPDLKVGDECAATVKLRVTNVGDSSYGKSIGFDIHELDDVTEETAEDEASPSDKAPAAEGELPEDDATGADESADEEAPEPEVPEEKVLGYKRPAKKLPTPPTKADFMD